MLEKLFPNNRLIKAEDLKKTWRIIVMVIVGQIIGLTIGFLFALHPDIFLSVWSGAAFGTLPGFILGTLWYFQNEERRKGIPYFTLGFFALGAIVLPVAAYFLLASGLAFNNLKSSIKSLDPSAMSQLVVYKGYRRENIIEIKDSKALASFTAACQDIENDYIQNSQPCNSMAEYYIELSDVLPRDIILDYCETDLAKGVFATRAGDTTTYHGTFSSKSLKSWLTKYVVTR